MLEADVLIVGGGPTGLAAANALGVLGVSVVLVEQDPGVAELPRAVSVDDEAMRFVQAVGLLDAAREVVVPGTGTKLYGARGQLLAYMRGPERPGYGHPVKNPMDHSEFQQMLLDGLARFPHVEVRHNTRFVEFTDDGAGVVATLDVDGGELTIGASYLLGADGGRSGVRTLIGEEPMNGSTFEQRWLVLDTVNDSHTERYAMHHGDPDRPRVVVVGRNGRCRYEFLVHEDETPKEEELLPFATTLVAPYRSLVPADVVRCTIYKFYALVADNFAKGRAFILGDAAHMMPPFAGQGLNSGLRDAFNLSWKLAAVIQGRAGQELLKSYTIERKPHVLATVELSVRMGKVMMTTSRSRALLRDIAVAAVGPVPLVRKWFMSRRFSTQVLPSTGFSIGVGVDPIAGKMLLQPTVLNGRGKEVALDDVIGPGFALLGVEVPSAALRELTSPLWDRLRPSRVHLTLGEHLVRPVDELAVSDLQGALTIQLAAARGRVLLVRPDRFVVGSFAPNEEAPFAAEVEALLGEPKPTAITSASTRPSTPVTTPSPAASKAATG